MTPNTKLAIATGFKKAIRMAGIIICTAAAAFALQLMLWIGYDMGLPM